MLTYNAHRCTLSSVLNPLTPLNMRNNKNPANLFQVVYFFRIQVISHTSRYD